LRIVRLVDAIYVKLHHNHDVWHVSRILVPLAEP
jgi:hypothetical protein